MSALATRFASPNVTRYLCVTDASALAQGEFEEIVWSWAFCRHFRPASVEG